MKQIATQGDFDAYVSTAEGAKWISDPAFERRCVELFDRFDAGEEMTVEAAAVFLNLPVNVFRHAMPHGSRERV